MRESLTDVLSRLLVGEDPAPRPGAAGTGAAARGGASPPSLLEWTGDGDLVDLGTELVQLPRGTSPPSRMHADGAATSSWPLVPSRGSQLVGHEAPLVPAPVPALSLGQVAAASSTGLSVRPPAPRTADDLCPLTELTKLGLAGHAHGGGGGSSGSSLPADDGALLITLRSSHPDHAEIVSVGLSSRK